MSRRSRMVIFCLWMCAALFAARGETPAGDGATTAANGAHDADAPAAQVVLELADGMRIVGTPSLEKLKMTTQFADVDIELSRVRTIEFKGADRAAEINLQNGDLLKGKLAATEIALKTLFGPVVIPLEKVSMIRVFGHGNAKPLPEGLVLYYNFDADEGKRIIDASGSGNDGKVIGATHIAAGKVRGALNLDGDGQMIVVGSQENLRLQNFTIMAWIKRSDLEKVCKTSVWADLVGYPHGGFGFGMLSNGHLYLSKSDFGTAFASVEIHDEAYHHVAVTKDGGKVVFYLDGTAYPATQDFGQIFVFGADLSVGGRSDSFQNTFLGTMDEVAVFKRALSEEEVKGVYEAQK